MERGKFIVLEGLSHTGKSMHARGLVEWLKKNNIPAIENVEPTNGNIFGTLIRVLTDQIPMEALNGEVFDREFRKAMHVVQTLPLYLSISKNHNRLETAFRKVLEREPLNSLEQQLLFIIDRYFDLKSNIIPHLELGVWVIQDRYELSTLAYGLLRGTAVLVLHDWQRAILANWYRRPDLTYFIDASPESIAARFAQSGKKLDQNEMVGNLEKTKSAYEEAIAYMGKGYRVERLDGDRSEEAIFADMCRVVQKEFLLEE